MAITLWLLRHAAAADEAPRGSGDRDRPLTDTGTKDALALGRFLESSELERPGVVLVSSAARARATALDVFASLPDDCCHFDGRLYGATPDDVLSIVAELVDPPSVIGVVGHNPTIASLIDLLAPPNDGRPRPCPPGTLAVITLPADDPAAIEVGTGVLELHRVP